MKQKNELLEIGTKTFNVYKYKDNKKIRTKISIPKQLYLAIREQQLCGFGCEDFIKIIQDFINKHQIEKNISQSVTAYLISRLVISAQEKWNKLNREKIVRNRILETYFIDIDNLPENPNHDLLKPFYNEEYYNLSMIERNKRQKKG